MRLAVLIIFWLVILAALILEIVSIIGIFHGSNVWTGIFAIITFLNVRSLAIDDARRKR